ncbi:MAG: dihydropteroate synthase [Flavobacteriales bacterium]|nr:dihydropteroate synthase [Flavobacteriales bacterium]
MLVMERPLVMGILNLTPDSFFDGGAVNSPVRATEKAGQMLIDGADILDLGAYSSRPGAVHISAKEELERLLPSLNAIRTEFPSAYLSIDTFRSTVAEAALGAGADIVNDISGGEIDTDLPITAARYNAPYICMHMRGNPQTMQQHLIEGPILPEILRFFSNRIEMLKAKGIRDIILDPGFGFGKTLAQNYELARDLPELGLFGHPVLVGVSRKSMVNKVIGTTPETALNGTTALHAMLLERGADILRVHDVKEAVEAVRLHLSMWSAGHSQSPVPYFRS